MTELRGGNFSGQLIRGWRDLGIHDANFTGCSFADCGGVLLIRCNCNNVDRAQAEAEGVTFHECTFAQWTDVLSDPPRHNAAGERIIVRLQAGGGSYDRNGD